MKKSAAVLASSLFVAFSFGAFAQEKVPTCADLLLKLERMRADAKNQLSDLDKQIRPREEWLRFEAEQGKNRPGMVTCAYDIAPSPFPTSEEEECNRLRQERTKVQKSNEVLSETVLLVGRLAAEKTRVSEDAEALVCDDLVNAKKDLEILLPQIGDALKTARKAHADHQRAVNLLTLDQNNSDLPRVSLSNRAPESYRAIQEEKRSAKQSEDRANLLAQEQAAATALAKSLDTIEAVVGPFEDL